MKFKFKLPYVKITFTSKEWHILEIILFIIVLAVFSKIGLFTGVFCFLDQLFSYIESIVFYPLHILENFLRLHIPNLQSLIPNQIF
jgi:hypothetical protein